MADKPLWAGRFSKPPDESLIAFSTSIHFDRRLLAQDVAVTRVHARGLKDAGLISSDDLDSIEGALDEAAAMFTEGIFPIDGRDEDIHSALERFLTDRLGDTGAKIHAGRSRNDLVVTDLRLWLKVAILRIVHHLVSLESVIVEVARAHVEDLMPGYTHLQRAQPISVAHHFLAHGFALVRDFRRFVGAFDRTDVSSLGAGALAGSTLPLDPIRNAKALGFAGAFDNSIDAVASRDFALEFMAASAICATNLSRIGEEIVLWTSEEFGYARLDDAFSTGSSIMPQKRNPDVGELTRGKTARIAGSLQTLLGVLKGLPLSYNRDLQEDKEPLFDTVDTIELMIPAITGALSTLQLDTVSMAEATKGGDLFATDLAEWLVLEGVPFRKAHEAVGTLVAKLESEGRSLESCNAEDLVAAQSSFRPEALHVLDARRSVEKRATHGATSPKRIAEQVEKMDQEISRQRAWIKNSSR